MATYAAAAARLNHTTPSTMDSSGTGNADNDREMA
jgi:hypothetical protein